MNKEIVAKAMNDLADDWHWVLLGDAEEVAERVYRAANVRTRCGFAISDTPRTVRLFDMGAPSEPTCQKCLDGAGGGPGLVAEIEEMLRSRLVVSA